MEKIWSKKKLMKLVRLNIKRNIMGCNQKRCVDCFLNKFESWRGGPSCVPNTSLKDRAYAEAQFLMEKVGLPNAYWTKGFPKENYLVIWEQR